jgi:hypothetical protein
MLKVVMLSVVAPAQGCHTIVLALPALCGFAAKIANVNGPFLVFLRRKFVNKNLKFKIALECKIGLFLSDT